MNRRRLLQAALGLCLVCLSWTIAPAPALALGDPQIPIGELAPEFTLPTNAGDGEIALADFRDQWVVLYFYPRDFTSGCTIEAQRFERDIAEYQARNAQVIGISADSVESHADFCDAEGLEFPLLSDPKGKVSKAYGSWLGAMSMRHTYIIGPDGTMHARFLGVQPVIHSREVLAELDKLQQAA